ncbi:WD40-repeat-containing domain protein [Cristinia sonorae]|uniref:WD40-repeat-containing domain protein n=1 Tax=Cristinia sonorae TaxID=1940300 RepID=A0A8K0UM40_9AGAR|nr:WD40-repeat-containing domain protein [Cristinia sonorae]
MSKAKLSKTPWKIYEEELHNKGFGLPLWYPEPSPKGWDLQIGDVGFIEDGGFIPMFNACSGQCNGGWGLPENFEPFDIRTHLVSARERAIPVGKSIFSAGVRVNHATAEARAADFAEASFNFHTSKERGAFLFVRGGAGKTEVMNNKKMPLYMLKNIDYWLAQAEQELGEGSKKPEDFIFVRGHVKTTSWGVAAFAGSQSRHGVTIAAGYGPVTGNIEIEHSDANTANIDSRWGPEDSDHDVADQCIFVNYFKFRRRLWMKAIQAAAGPHILPKSGDSDDEFEVVTRDTESETDEDPVNHLLNYILTHSDAEGAVASDGDLTELLGVSMEATISVEPVNSYVCDLLLPQRHEWPSAEQIIQHLEQLKPEIEVVNGVGMISQEYAVRRLHNGPGFAGFQFGFTEEPEAGPSRTRQDVGMGGTHEGSAQQHAQSSHQSIGGAGLNDAETADVASAVEAADMAEAIRIAEAAEAAEVAASFDEGFPNIPDDKLTPAGSTTAQGKITLGDRTVDWPHLQLVDPDENDDNACVGSFHISPNAELIAVGYEDGMVRVWNSRKWSLVLRISNHHQQTVSSLKFSPDSKLLASAARQVFVLDVQEAREGRYRELCELRGLGEDVNNMIWDLSFSPDSNTIAVASLDGKVRIYRANDGTPIRILDGLQGLVSHVKFSPDGLHMVATSDSSGYIWNAYSGELLGMLDGHTGNIWSIDFSPDSKRVVTGGDDHTCRIWNVENGEELVIIREHTAPVWTVGFSADGNNVMAGSYDRTVTICDSYVGTRRHLLQFQRFTITAGAFSPRGHFIAMGLSDGSVKLFDAAAGVEICDLFGHEDHIKDVQFSPRDDMLLTSADDGCIRVWSLVDILRVHC